MKKDYDFTPGRTFCDYGGEYRTIAGRDGEYITLTDGGRYHFESLARVLADDLTPEKLRQRKEQYDREQAALKARQEAEQAEQERQRQLYGYADTMRGVKLERVRSTLLKCYRYDNQYLTRADHIARFLKDGGRFEQYTYRSRPAFRVWPAAGKGGYFVDITKTEYDFARWLEGRPER